MGGHRYLDAPGFLVRILYATFLIFATYNVSGYSYFHWLTDLQSGDWILKFFVGALLAFGYNNLVEIANRSLRTFGIFIVFTFCGTLAWLVVDAGWIEINSYADLTTAMQIIFVAVLSIGVSYSHIHYRIGGIKQVEIV